ncbi:MAG TPA: HAD-IA family hydrolase [Phycisphaerales bacterium]|nr:HAD-IA family hydrolase [Phycisphaerales bacterium]
MPRTPTYSAILFDLDGTLIDSAACIVECFQIACVEHGLAAPQPHEVRATMGIPLERSMPAHAARLGTTLSAPQVQDMITTYRSHYARLTPSLVRPFDGVREMLDACRAMGVPMAIVTSKRVGPAEMNLRHVGFLEHFATIVGSDQVLRYKPEPDTVLIAAERMNITDLSTALVVGDATFDIHMGQAAGAKTCAATWGAHDRAELLASRPDHVIESPSELLSVLARGATVKPTT